MSDRFHADLSGAVVGSEIELDLPQSHHLLKVMRLEPGAWVVLFGGGQQSWATLVRTLNKHAILKLERVLEPLLPSVVAMCFAIPWLKGGKTEFIVQKLTELGGENITVFHAQREVARGGAAKIDRLQKVALEACKQCGRADTPAISESPSLQAAIAYLGADETNSLVLYELEKDLSLGSALKTVLQQRDSSDERVSICFATGPEGGLTREEIQSITHAAKTVTMGSRLLRAETAPLAAAVACLALAGDI